MTPLELKSPETQKSDVAGQHVIVVQLPADTAEDVDQVAQELAKMLDLGEYGATVTVVEPDLAEYINTRIDLD